MSEKKAFILTIDAGTARLVKAEILEKYPSAVVKNFQNLPTKMLVENLDFEELEHFRFYHNIIALESFLYLPDKKQESIDKLFETEELPFMHKGNSFRITAKRFGKHDFSSVDLQKSVGRIIERRFEKKVSLEKYDVNLRIDLIGNLCLWGEQLTNDCAETRLKRPYIHRAAVKQTLAHALLRLAELESGMSLLDCTCGSGTILAEAFSVFGEKIQIFGLELYPEIAEGARRNMAENGVSAEIRTGDAREMSEFFTRKFDRIVSNLPFGMVSGKGMDLKSFYFRMIAEADKVLHSHGKAVFMTARPGVLKEVLLTEKLFFVADEWIFDVGSLSPHVLVLEKVDKFA